MEKRFSLYALLFLMLLPACAGDAPDGEVTGQEQAPVPILFDTDFGPDYDDVGALAVLHALADSGEARILATVASTNYPLVGPAIDVVNTYYGHSDLPIGVAGEGGLSMGAWQHWPDTLVARFPHDLDPGEAPAAVEVYRSILSEQPNSSVTVVTVGFLTNLMHLLQSGPDSLSPLNGRELVEQKVARLVTMGGRFPEGREFNLHRDSVATQYVVDHWPTPILFSGFEIGWEILTGKELVAKRGPDNPVREAYRIAMAMSEEDAEGRKSWDQTAVLVAVRGAAPYFGTEPGRILVDSTGYNRWESGDGPHMHLTKKMSFDSVEQVIEGLMMR